LLKLTKKADYALMAMKHLAEHSAEGSRSAKDVADAYGIPPEALAKILQRLVKAGLLHSQHGTNGGYRLARERRRISVGDVVRVAESGIHSGADVARLRLAEYHACLVGESLMRAQRPGDALRELIAHSELRVPSEQ